jgi:uncharacterized membrane protein
METIAVILVIAGLVFMAAGAFLVFRPPPSPPPTPEGKPEKLEDIGEIIKQIKELLLVFEKNVRTGLAVMIMGLILVSLGIFLAVKDTKEEVKDQAPPATSAVVRNDA